MRPPSPADLPEPSARLHEGWHCLHAYYRVDPAAWAALSPEDRDWGLGEVRSLLDPEADHATAKLETCVVSGHKADLGLILMDPDPLKIDAVCQRLRATPVGRALEPTYSFVSISEVSEYVPTVEQYADRLKRDGADPSSPAFEARLNAYSARLPAMNQQRLYPQAPPDFPVVCFYPMNKSRVPGANWYRMPFSERSALMSEHAESGIAFAGRVTQFISASTGLDDWEWGVTLWARNPESVKDIVYTMRYDEASAGYAEFGPFYVGYRMPVGEALEHLRLR